VVIAIIALLGTVFVSSMGMFQAVGLTNAGDQVEETLSLARRTAIAHSHVVEMRFFYCANPSDPKSTVQWRAMQAVEILENGSEQPLGRAVVLPNRSIISATIANSPILQSTLSYQGTSPTNLGTVTDFRRFRFLPNGSTDLPLFNPTQTMWYLTVFSENDLARGNPPPNYVIIQIEPFTGAVATRTP
jgi:uncharacterized protein (TIGR02596 family)